LKGNEDVLKDSKLAEELTESELERHGGKIVELAEKAECDKDLKCIKKGSSSLCRAKDSGIENYVECNRQLCEEMPEVCKFSVPFGYSHFCKCPLRVYLRKKLKC